MQKTPNHTAVMVLGLTAFIGCCCYGIVGVILAIIGIVLANKDLQLIQENPGVYDNSINTWKIVNIVALVLSVLSLLLTIWSISLVGFENINNEAEIQRIIQEKFGQ
jgi:hypothetical protein